MQDARATDLNQDFFEDNEFYREQMRRLETCRFTFRDLLDAAQRAGLHVREFAWMPETPPVLFLGMRLPGWILPVKIVKLVLEKKRD